MLYAGHLPTRVYTQAQIAAMPQCASGDIPPEGHALWVTKSGKMVVTYLPPSAKYAQICAWRPIIRVRAEGRRA